MCTPRNVNRTAWIGSDRPLSGEKDLPSLDLVGFTALHAAAMQPHNEGRSGCPLHADVSPAK